MFTSMGCSPVDTRVDRWSWRETASVDGWPSPLGGRPAAREVPGAQNSAYRPPYPSPQGGPAPLHHSHSGADHPTCMRSLHGHRASAVPRGNLVVVRSLGPEPGNAVEKFCRAMAQSSADHRHWPSAGLCGWRVSPRASMATSVDFSGTRCGSADRADRYFPSWPKSAKTGICSPRHVRLGCRPRSGAGAWEPLA